ncbi:unnamed protein product [Macrosiphum euphorbiae]|uniref:Uncharacterized protein n=1 Tax=Macrosiphum euphorbiae TaxID=13131 RepID=A0AAV0W8X7_9HEMI|nr:unnamed protein product [Macrosiphum euphorbiae]
MDEKTYSRIVFYSFMILFGSGFLCFILFAAGQQAVSSSFVYRNTKEKFNCSNGVSIETSKVCDGRKDCSDGSDEIIGLCARNEYRNNFSTGNNYDVDNAV